MYDLDYFRDRLKISRHRLDEELELQADHFDRIGRIVAEAIRADAKAKQSLAEIEVRLIRALSREDPKLPLNRAQMEIQTHPDYKEAVEAAQAARKHLNEAESLQKSWYQRGFDLKALADLHGQGYYSTTTTSFNEPRITEIRAAQRAVTPDYSSVRATRRAAADHPTDEPARRRSRLNVD